jgi:hypothetical protein
VKRTVVGIQMHHHTNLDDACRGAAIMLSGLHAAARVTGDPRLLVLHDQLQAATRELAREREAATERFRGLYAESPERFKRCRDGFEPWPDETPEGFVPRCTCNDKCLHRFGVEPGANGICNCEGVKPPCPAHP